MSELPIAFTAPVLANEPQQTIRATSQVTLFVVENNELPRWPLKRCKANISPFSWGCDKDPLSEFLRQLFTKLRTTDCQEPISPLLAEIIYASPIHD